MGLVLLAASLAASGPAEPPGAEWLRRAREACEAARPGDAGAALRLVAILLLEGGPDRARDVAARLLREGMLAPGEGDASARARRALELCVGPSPDPEAALALLGRGDSSEALAPLVARAFALARAGRSLDAAAGFEELARRLRDVAGLDVRRMRYVRRVESFGVYEEDARALFRPGDPVLVYAEIGGFRSEPVPEAPREEGAGPRVQRWRVLLEVRFALRERLSGKEGPSWGPERVEHVTRSEINDLHVTRLITLPADLPGGEHELRLEVRDLAAEGRRAVGLRRLAVKGEAE